MQRLVRLVAIAAVGFASPALAQEKWERANDVSVVWKTPRGIAKIRFDGEDDYSPEKGCSRRPVEVVTVLSADLHTPNGADDLFRGRTVRGDVNSYRIPLNDAPRVIFSWLEDMLEEGKTLRVYSGSCGNAGLIYVSQIEVVTR